MARSPAQAALDEIVRTGLTPLLKTAGYRKDGHTFRRARERCVQVVNVQSSRWSTADEVQFTLNVGVFFPDVHALMDLGWGPGPKGPTESHCTFRERIGMLLPAGVDRWWTVSSRPRQDESARISAEIRDAVERHGLPWLERLADPTAARDEAERQDALFPAAALSVVLGDEAAARRIVERCVREHPRATAVADWARARGLLP